MGMIYIPGSRMELDFSITTQWNNFFKIVRETISLLRILYPAKSNVRIERVLLCPPKYTFHELITRKLLENMIYVDD